jgi:hypothetical protein
LTNIHQGDISEANVFRLLKTKVDGESPRWYIGKPLIEDTLLGVTIYGGFDKENHEADIKYFVSGKRKILQT